MRFRVREAEAGRRLDLALATLAGVPRSQARRWIDAGRVRVDGNRARAAHRVREGEALEAEPPEPVSTSLEAEPIPLAILYEDADVIVVNKPAGLVVHPAPGHSCGTLVNALLHHCGRLSTIGGPLRRGVVHRLDRGTSGALVAAKTDRAHRALAAQFRAHHVTRLYLALVRGVPGSDAGRIERRVGRHRHERKRMSVRSETGREARTGWRVRRRFPRSGLTWLEVCPETGRTHQIRVHLASAGLPVVGDPVYGRARRPTLRLARPALHAAVLGFAHPRSGATLRCEAPLASDLAEILAELERREGAT